MNILITGGLGFIGSNLVPYCLQRDSNNRVIVYDKLTYAANNLFLQEIKEAYPERFQLIEGDICDADRLRGAVEHADWIFHLAAETHVGKSNFLQDLFVNTNIVGVHKLLQCMQDARGKRKVLFASSAEVYGSLPEGMKAFHEDSPRCSRSLYAVTKCTGEDLFQFFSFLYGIEAVVVRLFNNYGPRQHPEKVIPRFIYRALNQLPLEIEGDGKATRDWIYVEDTCRALYELMSKKLSGCQVVNIAANQEVSILEIAERVLDYTSQPRSLIRHVAEREGNVLRHFASNDKMRRLIGFKPEIPFGDRLTGLVDWYMANTRYFDPHIYNASYDAPTPHFAFR